jgi:hypothetical protein
MARINKEYIRILFMDQVEASITKRKDIMYDKLKHAYMLEHTMDNDQLISLENYFNELYKNYKDAK